MARPARRIVPFLSFVFAAGAGIAQTDTTTSDVPASALLAKLASRDVSVAEARAAVTDLATRTAAVRLEMVDAVRRAYGAALERCEKSREKLHKDFAKAIAAAQRASITAAGEAKVEQMRKQVLAVTARADLTKEMIVKESDPLLAELRTIVIPTAQQVFDRDQKLAAELAAYLQLVVDTDAFHDLCLEAAFHVDADPAGRAHAAKTTLAAPPPSVPIDVEFEADCLLGLTLSAQDEKALRTNETLRGKIDAAEFAGTLELNRIRMALGLNALKIDEKLGNAGRDHSQDMVKLGFFAHESPVEGKRSFTDRASRAGTSASSENIAQGHPTGESAVHGWWHSPGHHKNMLGNHARTGLGRHEQTWTQLFGG